MPACCFLDNDCTHLALPLGQRGYSVATTPELGRERASDQDQLLFAAQRGWILITHNRAHFVLLHCAWARWSQEYVTMPPHSGVLVAARGPAWPKERIAESIDQLLRSNRPGPKQLYLLLQTGAWVRD